jgi:hypothetical protein
MTGGHGLALPVLSGQTGQHNRRPVVNSERLTDLAWAQMLVLSWGKIK